MSELPPEIAVQPEPTDADPPPEAIRPDRPRIWPEEPRAPRPQIKRPMEEWLAEFEERVKHQDPHAREQPSRRRRPRGLARIVPAPVRLEQPRKAANVEVGAAAAARGRAVLRDRAARRIRRNRMDQQGVGMSSDFSLFERHVDALYRSALRLTRKPEDAEDLVQETYLRAYRYRNRFKPGTNEKAWLFTIMTNVFRNSLRKRGAPEDPIDQPGTDFSIYDQMRRDGIPVHWISPAEIIVDRGFGDEVKHALEELPVPMRMVVVLVDVEDF